MYDKPGHTEGKLIPLLRLPAFYPVHSVLDSAKQLLSHISMLLMLPPIAAVPCRPYTLCRAILLRYFCSGISAAAFLLRHYRCEISAPAFLLRHYRCEISAPAICFNIPPQNPYAHRIRITTKYCFPSFSLWAIPRLR